MQLEGRRSLVAVVVCLVISIGCSSVEGGSSVETVADSALPTPIATTPPVAAPQLPTAQVLPTPTTPPPVPEPTAAPAAPTAVPTALPDATPTTPAVPAAPTATSAPAPTATIEPDPTATTVAPAPTTPEPPSDLTGGQGDGEAPPQFDRYTTAIGYQALGTAGSVQLVLPAQVIEVIGFHEAGHPGSQPIDVATSGAAMMILESRSRGTSPTSAADIVVPPGQAVVAPVTGTVIASNSYVLYCQHQDALVYIEPDGLPGWQVRVFHVEGETIPVGSRVAAGETVIATQARTLPFESQVDEFTAEPSWPHVHIEVVDTTVPDDRPPGPGCP